MLNSTYSRSRMRLASRLCTLGAWAILGVGCMLVVVFYAINTTDTGPDSGPNLGIILFVSLLIAMLAVFFFLVLYSLGALLTYMSERGTALKEDVAPAGMKNTQEEDGTQLEITPLHPRG